MKEATFQGLGVPVTAVSCSDWPNPDFLTYQLVTGNHWPVRLPGHLAPCVYLGLLYYFFGQMMEI